MCVQDYESKISTLQEQLERHSMMSSMTFEDFDADDDEDLGDYCYVCTSLVVFCLTGFLCTFIRELTQFGLTSRPSAVYGEMY